VESDDPQVIVNQRFAVFSRRSARFFSSKRGFFPRRLIFFLAPDCRPAVRSRMTGKLGKWTLGALAIDDRQPGKVFTSRPV